MFQISLLVKKGWEAQGTSASSSYTQGLEQSACQRAGSGTEVVLPGWPFSLVPVSKWSISSSPNDFHSQFHYPRLRKGSTTMNKYEIKTMPGKYGQILFWVARLFPNQPFFPKIPKDWTQDLVKITTFGVWQFCGKISEVSLITWPWTDFYCSEPHFPWT